MKTDRKKTPQPIVLMSWKARRAAAAITIEGIDALGQPHKEVGVKSIERRPDTGTIAVTRDGHRLELR